MNRVNIKRVRDVIAALPAKRFDMRFTYDGEPEDFDPGRDPVGKLMERDCGTAACIAGWTIGTLTPTRPLGPDPLHEAAELLGLDYGVRHLLFVPPDYDVKGRYTQADAVRVLDHLLETGEVDWVSTRRAKKPAVAK